MTGPLRLAIIASSQHPIRQPFAGGLEAQIWTLVRALRDRGHQVTLFAGAGSDPCLDVTLLPIQELNLSGAARRDASMAPERVMEEHHAYLGLMLSLGRTGLSFDVVHNHSLHYLPIAMAEALPVPMITTLHTPPTPWIESAVSLSACDRLVFTAVSAHAAAAWRHLIPNPRVVANGVDTTVWKEGPGGDRLIWFGRITPEKGTHLAALAARQAGRPLDIAGPVSDIDYFVTEVRPLLSDAVRYLGHVKQAELVRMVGSAAMSVVTPCWDEPFGLVVAESLACGTPVAGFAVGALPELTDGDCAHLVPAGDVQALARALAGPQQLSRAKARRRAEQFYSVAAMMESYESLYRSVVGRR